MTLPPLNQDWASVTHAPTYTGVGCCTQTLLQTQKVTAASRRYTHMDDVDLAAQMCMCDSRNLSMFVEQI